jgi:hypothetical protein
MFANNEKNVPLTTPSLQVCEVSPLEDVATVLLYTLDYSTLQPDDRIREKRACSTHATGRVDENGYEVRGDCRSPRQRTPQTKPFTERGSSSPTCMHGKHSNIYIYRGGVIILLISPPADVNMCMRLRRQIVPSQGHAHIIHTRICRPARAARRRAEVSPLGKGLITR